MYFVSHLKLHLKSGLVWCQIFQYSCVIQNDFLCVRELNKNYLKFIFHKLIQDLRLGWMLSHSVTSDSFWPHELQPTRLLCPWNYPGKNTGVGCHSLLQGIFRTQGLNSSLLHKGRFFILRATREAHSRFLIQISLFSLFNTNMHTKSLQLCATLWTTAWRAFLPRGTLQTRTTGVGCHALLKGIFPTQGSTWHLLHLLQVLCH